MNKKKTGPVAGCMGCFFVLVTCGGVTSLVVMLLSDIELPANTPAKPETVSIYTSDKDMICPTSSKFLDSSPLLSPANFAKVQQGTQVIIADMGGIGSGRMYYGLSAGGGQRVYVYRDIFDANFTKTETVER